MPMIDTTGIRPIERRQPTDDISRIRRRDEGGGGFRPQTNVNLKTAIQEMAATLGKIGTSEKYGIQKLPQEVGEVVKNILRQALSVESTLGKGIGSTVESQRFSMDQLMLFSRLLLQVGTLAEKGYSMKISEDTQALLTNLKSVLVSQEGGEVLEPVLITKSAFELVDAKTADQLPQALYEILSQLSQPLAATQRQQPQSESMQFLKQLVKFFMPRPGVDTPIEEEPQQQPQQSRQFGGTQRFLQSMFKNFGGRFSQQGQPNAQFQQQTPQGQPNAQFQQQTSNGQPNAQFQQQTSNGQPNAQFQQQTPQGQPNAQFQQQTSNGQPNAQFQQQTSNGQPNAQFQQQTPNGQPNAQFQQQTSNGQPNAQFQQQTSQGQPNAQFQQQTPNEQPNAQFQQQTPQGQPNAQFLQQTPQGQPNAQFLQQTQQGQPQPQFQQQTPNEQPNAQFQQQNPQGQPQVPYLQKTPMGQPQKVDSEFIVRQREVREQIDVAKKSMLKQNLQNTPQTTETMKNLAQFLLRDTQMTPRDTALLQNFVNNSQSTMSEDEARHLQNLLRLCQNNIPATVRQAAIQQNLPDLPRLWAFMQMCDMAGVAAKMNPRNFKKAGKDVADFVTTMRHALSAENSVMQTRRSFQMMMPLYMGDNDSTYPTYINVYNETERDPDTGEYIKETWLRICVLTDYIGAAELVFRIHDENHVDMRFYFSRIDIAEEFRSLHVDDLRASLKETDLAVGEIRVGGVGERMFSF